MPFGPKNVPVFYTVIMQILRDDWLVLLEETKYIVTATISPATFICSDKIGIDGILLYSNYISIRLDYFCYIATVFTKYRISLKLFNCDLFKPRVEFVGHCPAQSNFKLIQDWYLPLRGTYLLSFIGICVFYNQYCPWFEKNVKILRRLQRLYHHTPIPIIFWSTFHVSLFAIYKSNLVFSSLFHHCDSSKPVFLKTDWSSNGIDFILM